MKTESARDNIRALALPGKYPIQHSDTMLMNSVYPLVIFAGTHAPFARHRRFIGMETISNNQFNELIFVIRGRKVMLSFHLAPLYGVEVRVLAQAVKRNSARFPEDFMFQLTSQEVDC